jgi:thiamine-monophosphate kinase
MNKPGPRISDIGEFELLARIRDWLADSGPEVVLGIGDDAAAFKLPDGRLGLLSSDLLLEGIHFDLSYTTPYQLGWKALAVNLSDIAAMGGVPRYALVSLALPGDTRLELADGFYQGLRCLGDEYSVAIIGGDTSASASGIMVSLSVWGEVEPDLLLSRRGAKVGDRLVVTGQLGEAAAGLALLKANKSGSAPGLVKRQLTPTPRCREARIIAQGRWANSMIDLSDGLASDIRRLAQESKVGAKIRLERLPVSQAVAEAAKQSGRSAYQLAVSGGEDYELLFTVSPDKIDQLTEAFGRQSQTPLSIIGQIEPAEQGICFLDAQGKKVDPETGYEHFRQREN